MARVVWGWALELSPHVLERMEDRGFSEVDLREMMDAAERYRGDISDGRWVIETRHRRKAWEVIVEPDFTAEALVVVTAYPRSRNRR